MDLLQEYKELYYREIEFNDILNNKITTCITFLTIIGSALILLWTQFKHYTLSWYTILFLIICLIDTTMFIICIAMFLISYSGYKRPTFPIRDIALQNMKVLNKVPKNETNDAIKVLENTMAERFINDAIANRKLNIIKSKRHNRMIKIISITLMVTFIAFAVNIAIDYYETKYINNNVQQTCTQGGDKDAR